MAENELKLYYNAYTDVWKLFKQFSDVKDNDIFWDCVIANGESICEKYKNTDIYDLSVKLVQDTILQLGKIMRAKYEKF